MLDDLRDSFESLARTTQSLLHGGESFELNLHGEDSEFVRLNRGAVRQAGSVVQRTLSLDLAEGKRHAAGTLRLSGDPGADRQRVAALVRELRAQRDELPEDPWLLSPDEPLSSERVVTSALPERDEVLDRLVAAGRERDLVGLYASGPVVQAFASSRGQRNWFVCPSFNLDWSFHLEADRAVKASYAGTRWDGAAFSARLERACDELALLARPTRHLPPGRYPVYLAPDAVAELMGLLSWGGFGLRALRTKTSPLLRMVEAGEAFHETVTIAEDTAAGTAPDFQEQGFRRPERVPLVEAGKYRASLVSPRSAVEFDAATNGATSQESPLSLDVAAGDVPTDDVLRRLGSGIHVSNLHYLNYSDRIRCRATGMTRFACFAVEGGERVAPIGVLRFDDTLFRMLGANLIGLTRERETILDPGTYGGRSVGSTRVPGALVDDVAFTL
ncbi:TldE/PmbA family protein [Candidatus Binatia bacterium]|nr:TldE/PmbA family protein [Candidatus Binatia bacterium]